MGHFLGFFKGAPTFGPKIALRYAQDNLGVKKVSVPSKNPSKCHIICFARKKKSCTFRISGTLIVIIFGALCQLRRDDGCDH
jgi:hypothetical protein